MPLIDKDSLREAFRQIFKLEAYDFQIKVAQHLLNGKSVVLQAPTGAGKTNTALFPFFYAFQYLEAPAFPRKMIYSVERKILVNNFYADVQKTLQEEALRETLSQRNQKLEASVLTGERPEDPELRQNVVFTTIDQTLSSFLMVPYSLSQRAANLNAGAIASSYLVFDEAHLFDPETALPTLMWMLQRFKGVTPSLLMTATFSEPVLKKLAEITGGEIVTVSPEELKQIPAQATKKRCFVSVDSQLTGKAVLEKHVSRSIVVCNTVDRAQKLYDELAALTAGTDTRLLMLHARYFQSDRQAKEKELLKLFGKRKNNHYQDNPDTDTSGSAILIATQVIEVGVDITSENLHSELAPANTILQRAGRCARHPDEEGTVYVYQVEKKLPYKESEALFEPTFQNIQAFGQMPVTFEKEQALINAVHTVQDEAGLERIKANASQHANKIEQTLNSLEPNYRRELIRDADSRSILVHPEPSEITDPYAYESFSIFDGSFMGKMNQLQQQAVELDCWAVRYPVYIENEAAKEQIERRPGSYKWVDIKPGDDASWQPLVVVNPRLVSYDSERGFRFELNQGADFQSKVVVKVEKEREHYSYRLESYAEHIRNVNWAYGYFKFEDEIAFAASRLQERLGPATPAGLIDRAIRLSFVFHDAGKLTQDWQRAVHGWQRFANKTVAAASTMLAHTDYDWQYDRELERQYQQQGGKRPPHAVEGAAIVQKFLKLELGEMARPVVSAIARHHAPTAKDLNVFKLHSAAYQALNEALATIWTGQPWNLQPGQLMAACPQAVTLPENLLTKASNQNEHLLFMLIIRVLRLADQNSFKYYEAHSAN
ncbi:MAG TPA: CRISPR-associated helicase Cas3' [Chloroflexia bacterium]|nr:CRISPR-associated helicase Cas3' [Chloroflexia bacterium]